MAAPSKVPIGGTLGSYPGRSHNLFVDHYYRDLGPPKSHNAQPGGCGPQLVVTVKNDSGGDVEPGYVLGIDTLIVTYTDRDTVVYEQPAFSCITPAVPTHTDQFVVIRAGIADGEVCVGGGVLVGGASVKIDVIDAAHEYAYLEHGTKTHMNSGSSGRKIIWKETGTGVKWGVVLMTLGVGAGDAIICKAPSGISGRTSDTPGTATVDVYEWDGTDLQDSGVNVTAYNLAAAAVASNVYLQAKKIGGRYVVDWEECT